MEKCGFLMIRFRIHFIRWRVLPGYQHERTPSQVSCLDRYIDYIQTKNCTKWAGCTKENLIYCFTLSFSSVYRPSSVIARIFPHNVILIYFLFSCARNINVKIEFFLLLMTLALCLNDDRTRFLQKFVFTYWHGRSNGYETRNKHVLIAILPSVEQVAR